LNLAVAHVLYELRDVGLHVLRGVGAEAFDHHVHDLRFMTSRRSRLAARMLAAAAMKSGLALA
jgi:hypothetical protein